MPYVDQLNREARDRFVRTSVNFGLRFKNEEFCLFCIELICGRFFMRGLNLSTFRWIASAFLACGVLQNAQAAYTITVSQVGADVVASGTGSLNLASLAGVVGGNASSYVEPNAGDLVVGPIVLTAVATYTGAAGPANFGGGAFAVANAGTGSISGIDANAVIVPAAYVSNAALAGTATWTGQTIVGLGMTPGTYTWTWGAGPTADSLVVQIGPVAAASPQSIPTLSEWGMIFLSGILGLGAFMTLRRQR